MTQRRGGRTWVVVGSWLFGLPTLFTVMAPAAATYSTGLRALVASGWIPAVAVAGWFAGKREEQGDDVRRSAMTDTG